MSHTYDPMQNSKEKQIDSFKSLPKFYMQPALGLTNAPQLAETEYQKVWHKRHGRELKAIRSMMKMQMPNF